MQMLNLKKKDEVYKLWLASQTSIPAAAVKTIMLLPCVRLQFLEEIDEKCAEAWNCWPLCHTCNKE